jgi:TolB-like protein/DNA-binding winged helix-turn-helix (wHTH) protein
VHVPVFEFGDFRLDSSRFELLREGRSLKLERKPMELLILLASSNGRLFTRAEIAEKLWSSEVFVDTEHGINTAIRKIRQVLRDDSEEPRFIQTVMGKGYRFIAPVTIIDASPNADSPAVPTETAASESIPAVPAPRSPRSHAKLWLAVAALILLAATLALTLGPHPLAARLRHPNPAPPITSLAVLPLDNLSGDPSQEYFADGMTDEFITMLAKDSTLRITSRTSVMQYKGAHRPLPEIARALNVDGILEGSISRTPDKVHLTLQLIRADTDTHLWAESYDRDAGDVVSLPQEAALTIAKRLNSAATPTAAPRYVNPEAHDAYLHGHYLWYADQNEKSFEYFKKATELQPDYAPGWAGLSEYYGAGMVDGLLDPATSRTPEEGAAIKAVQLDDSLPEAHLALCAAYLVVHWDWTRSDPECQRAIQLDPEFAEAHHFRAKIFAALNRHPEAIEEQKKAAEIDPFGRPWALAYSYQLARQYDAALTEAHQRLETARNDRGLHWILYETYRCKGMGKEATEELEKMQSLDGDATSVAGIKQAYRQGGYKAVVHWQLISYEKWSKSHYVSPIELALLHAELGDRERTIALLEAGYKEHSPYMLWIQCDPAYDFLHADPRYRFLIQRIGLPPQY